MSKCSAECTEKPANFGGRERGKVFLCFLNIIGAFFILNYCYFWQLMNEVIVTNI